MSEQSEREAIIREIAKKKVRYTLPAMDRLPVHRGLPYRDDLLMDIYCPARQTQPVPVVIIPLGYPDPKSGVRTFGPVTSWAQLIAASGMAAVLYGSTEPAEDVHRALRFVRDHSAALGLDGRRIGIVSSSGSVPVALSAVMRDTTLKAAALLCGYTMDLDGSALVADMAAQFGFVNACAGKSVDDLPSDVPVLWVRAGDDQSPGLNDALDAVIGRSLARNLPLTVVNHAVGAHGFDCDEDTEISRAIVKQVLGFLSFHLQALV